MDSVAVGGAPGASRGLPAALARQAKRPVVVVGVVLVLVGGAIYFGYRSAHHTTATPTSLERIATVTTGTIRQTVATSGTLEPADTEDLSFAVSGKVTAVNVKAGQTVAAGAVLATIDSAALQSQVTQAQATVASNQAKLSSDTTAGATSAQLAADQANLDAANGSLATAQASLAGASLVAPIAGTVSVVNLTVGEQLGSSGNGSVGLTGTGSNSGRTGAPSSGTGAASSSSSTSSSPEVEVISTGSFVVNLNVDDTQISRLAVGQAATVTPSTATGAIGGRFRANATTTTVPDPSASTVPAAARTAVTATGTVTSVGQVASSSSGVSSFPVVVTVAGSPAGFYSGATVLVAITYNQLANVVEVPTAAINQSGGQSTVTVTNNGAKSTQVITTGVASGGMTQVLTGLSPGDQVVITLPAATASSGATARTGAANTGGFGGGGNFPAGGFKGGGAGAGGGG
jgi:multidrug efflux pump subunit AcrA (membrane-fusion protein)